MKKSALFPTKEQLFGPAGTGGSWASMAVLVDELADAESSGRSVLFFDEKSRCAYVFGNHSCVCIENISSLA